MEELFEQIVKANSEIKTINLKGKDYCEVKERVIAFRKVFTRGRIITDVKYSENYIMVEAKIYANFPMGELEDLLATANARELANKPFALENCETSAIGRALGFCGFGISTSIATKEDINNIDSLSGVFDLEDDAKRRKDAIEHFNKLATSQKANIMNVVGKDLEKVEVSLLESLIRNAI